MTRTLTETEVTAPESRYAGGRSATAGAVLLEALAEQSDHLLAQAPRVLARDPAGVAEMRVDTRRLRCILTGYRRVLDRRRTDVIVADLKWLGAELADERDTEVMAERFTRVLEKLPHDLVLGPVAADLDRALGQRSEEDTRRILAALDSVRFAGLREQLDDLLTDPPLCSRSARLAHRELPLSVARAYRKLERRLAAADRVADALDRADALHEARKAAKRVRYMCEVAEPAVGEPATRLRKRAGRLQKLLGEHQDAAVARPTLHGLGREADRHGHSAFTYGVLYAAEHFRARDAERALPELLERLRAAEATAWLDRP